jgi:IS5 family transposase
MTPTDMFRTQLDALIDLRHPLAVLAKQTPWDQIEIALVPFFQLRNRVGRIIQGNDLFGTSAELAGAGVIPAGRPACLSD